MSTNLQFLFLSCIFQVNGINRSGFPFSNITLYSLVPKFFSVKKFTVPRWTILNKRHKNTYYTATHCSISNWNCLLQFYLPFLFKGDTSWSGGDGILLSSHTRTTPTSAPERWATWLTFCKEYAPRKLPDRAVEAWAASMTYYDQKRFMDKCMPFTVSPFLSLERIRTLKKLFLSISRIISIQLLVVFLWLIEQKTKENLEYDITCQRPDSGRMFIG